MVVCRKFRQQATRCFCDSPFPLPSGYTTFFLTCIVKGGDYILDDYATSDWPPCESIQFGFDQPESKTMVP